MTTYVKKIVSLNPTRYKYLDMYTAINLYGEYIVNYCEYCTKKKLLFIAYKDFNNWLKTEI